MYSRIRVRLHRLQCYLQQINKPQPIFSPFNIFYLTNFITFFFHVTSKDSILSIYLIKRERKSIATSFLAP